MLSTLHKRGCMLHSTIFGSMLEYPQCITTTHRTVRLLLRVRHTAEKTSKLRKQHAQRSLGLAGKNTTTCKNIFCAMEIADGF